MSFIKSSAILACVASVSATIIPSSLSSGFDAQVQSAFQVQYAGKAISDGALVAKEDCAAAPKLSFGASAGLDASAGLAAVLIDTSSSNNLYCLQGGLTLDGSLCLGPLLGGINGELPYTPPCSLGEVGIHTYSWLIYKQHAGISLNLGANAGVSLGAVLGGVGAAAGASAGLTAGASFDVGAFLGLNGLLPACAGLGFIVDCSPKKPPTPPVQPTTPGQATTLPQPTNPAGGSPVTVTQPVYTPTTVPNGGGGGGGGNTKSTEPQAQPTGNPNKPTEPQGQPTIIPSGTAPNPEPASPTSKPEGNGGGEIKTTATPLPQQPSQSQNQPLPSFTLTTSTTYVGAPGETNGSGATGGAPAGGSPPQATGGAGASGTDSEPRPTTTSPGIVTGSAADGVRPALVVVLLAGMLSLFGVGLA